jgi:hypothetical protein
MAVIDYSGMSYAELVKVANNDAIADAMSEEEYESLSVELWRKFAVEKRIAAQPETAFYRGLEPRKISAGHEPSLSRSGD